MKEINFDKISLIDEVNKCNNKYLECIAENNSANSLNFKSLIFKVTYNEYSFEIRMFIQENDNELSIEVLFENVCKNVDVDDAIMDCIIIEISKCAKAVKNKLETYDDIRNKLKNTNGLIKADSMIIEQNEYNLTINLDSFKDKIEQLYNKLKPTKMEYNNYINELLVFGINGRNIAMLLKELNIAEFRRSRSGYLISFLEDIPSYSNSFIYNFSRELSNMDIPSIAIPIDVLDYSW